jgi:hypothetical protein
MMSHVLSDEQMATYMKNMKTAQEVLETSTKQLAEGEKKLRELTDLLGKSTEDIQVLLAFIRSRGLQPPTIQSGFIN